MLQYTTIRPEAFEQSLIEVGDDNPLAAKLERFVRLGSAELQSIDSLCQDQIKLSNGDVIIEEGARPDHVCVIVEGFASRYKVLPGGRRQILGYLVPGDLCDVHFTLFDRLDHSIASLGDTRVARIPIEKLLDLLARHPVIERGLSLAALVDRSILHEWLLNIGQRNAYQKLSHFFCEMSVRLKSIGHVNADGSIELPLDQTALAETTGLTLVHINRTLQRMRSEGLIEVRRRRLRIWDPQQLAEVTEFEGNYLALQLPTY